MDETRGGYISQILNLLSIEHGEQRKVGYLWLIGVLVGAVLTVFSTAATAMFLQHFDSSKLPYMYIGGAILTVAFGALFNWIGTRASSRSMFTVYNLFVVVAILAVWLALRTVGGKWSIAGAFLIMDSLWSFAGIVLSGFTLSLLSIRQSKRLGGIIGTGWVAGVFVSGVSLGWLAQLFNSENLILLSAGLMVAVFLICLRMSTLFAGQLDDESSLANSQKSAKSRSFLRNRLVWMILLTYTASFGIFYFTDMMFLNEMEKKFPTEREFTAFFGVFAGVGSILVFLGQGLLFNRFIARFGLFVTMIALPAAMILFGTTVIYAGIAGGTVLLFWMVASQRMSYTVVGNVMDAPTQGVLMQAVPASQQAQLNAFIGGIVAPVATILFGAILLLLTSLDAGPVAMNLTLIPICIVWIILSVVTRNEYVKAIVDTVARRKLPALSLEMDPELMAKMILPNLQSGSPGEVIYCLGMLEKLGHKALNHHLIDQLDNDNHAVVEYAIDRITGLGLKQAAAPIKMLLKSGPPELRGRALMAHCALYESDALDDVEPYLNDSDKHMQRAAMIGMLRYSGIDGVLAAGSRFNDLRFSSSAPSRQLAAEVIGNIGISQFYRPLAQLLEDDDMETRRQAVKSAAALKNSKLLPALVKALAVQELRANAVSSIVAYGPEIAPILINEFQDNTNPFVSKWIIRLAGKIGGEELTAFLVELVVSEDPKVRSEALRALVKTHYQAAGEVRKRFVKTLETEIDNGAWLEVRRSQLDTQSDSIVNEAVIDELRACRRRLFQLLACIYPAETIIEAAARLESGSDDERAFAIEAFDNIIRGQCRPQIVGIAENVRTGFATIGTEKEMQDDATADTLTDLVVHRFGSDSNFRVVVAMEALAKSSSPPVIELIENQIGSPEPAIRETAIRLTHKLAPDNFARLAKKHSIYVGRSAPSRRVLFLKEAGIFKQLPAPTLLKIAEVADEQRLQPGERFITEGEMGETLFVIVEGTVRVHDSQSELATLGAGEVVGELAALDPEPRNASVTAISEALVYRLNRDTLVSLFADYQSIVEALIHVLCVRIRGGIQVGKPMSKDLSGQSADAKQEPDHLLMSPANDVASSDGLRPIEKVLLLKQVDLIRELPEETLLQLGGVLIAEEYGARDRIIEKGKYGDCLYIIFKGTVRVHDGDTTLTTLGENQSFGELAALDGEVRASSVSAVDRVSVYRLNRSDLMQSISENIEASQGILRYLCRWLREQQLAGTRHSLR